MIRTRMLSLGVLSAMALLCAGLSATARGDAAEGLPSAPSPPENPPPQASADTKAAPQDGAYQFPHYNFLGDGTLADPSQAVVRFGYWGSHNTGSPVKVGEYQDLNASPFYDIDGLRTDGRRTLNYTITGTDSETNAVNLNFYRPGVETNVEYQRFPHELGHENLGEFPNFNVTGTQQFRRQDVNPGEDYAVRVQELKANFKCQVNDYVKVRLDVWGFYKEGEREARAMQECYAHTDGLVPDGATSNRTCHVLSQMQHIDWQTTELKPIIELNLGPVVMEYSRPMRVFTQNDQDVFRFYDAGSAGSSSTTSEFGLPRFMQYGVVPDSDTQIDQLKLSANLDDCNKFYGFLFVGNTHKVSDIATPIAPDGSTAFAAPPDDDRVSNRHFDGADVRWTNTAIKNVTITTYGRINEETNEPAQFLIPGEETRPGTVGNISLPIEDDPTQITPINYRRGQVGSKFVWRPFGAGYNLGGLAINGGYEYSAIHRENLEVDTGSDDPPFEGTIVEEDTHSNIFTIGPSMRWSPQLDTYLRYKWCNTVRPLFATNSHETVSTSGTTFDYQALSLNSAFPTHDDLVEMGGTWMPSDRFMANAWFGIDIQSQHFGQALVVPGTATTVVPLDAPLGFNSQSFPFGVNGVYRVDEQWTLNGGYAYYTNFIDQDVTFGAGIDHGFVPYGLLVNEWAFASRASVFNLGTSYDLTCNVRLIGLVEYVRGLQSAFLIGGDPRFPDATTATAGIPQYFRQDVVTTRVSTGVDWRLSRRWTSYFRYVLFDYQDSADQQRIATSTLPVNGLPLSGTSNLFLGGVTGVF